jgi:hypothetical protein
MQSQLDEAIDSSKIVRSAIDKGSKDLEAAAMLPTRRSSHSSTQEDQAIKQSSGPGHDGSSSSSAQGGISSAPSKPILAPRKLLSRALKPLGPIPDIIGASASLPPRGGSISIVKAQSQTLARPLPLSSNSVMVVDGKIVPIGWRPSGGDGLLDNPKPIKTTAAPSAAIQKPECDTPQSGASDAAKDLLLSLDKTAINFPAPQQSFSISLEGMGASPGSKAPSAHKASDKDLLLEALNAWRASRLPNPSPGGDGRHKASSLNSVLPNAVVEALALARPKSIIELQGVPGMTPARIQKLGQELLDVVRQHLHTQLQLTKGSKAKDKAPAPLPAFARTSAATSSNTSASARVGDEDSAAEPPAPPVVQELPATTLRGGAQDNKASSEGDDDSSSSMMQLLMSRSRKDQQAFAALAPHQHMATFTADDEEPMAMQVVAAQGELLDNSAPEESAPGDLSAKQQRRPRRKADEAGLEDEREREPKKKGKKEASSSLHPDGPTASFKPPYPGGPAFLNRVSDAALKQYSSEEDRWILKQVAAGMPESDVAAVLRRSRNAIVRRVRLLIARATSAGSVVAPPSASQPAGSSAVVPMAMDAPAASNAPLPDALAAAANPSEEAAAVKAILNARAAAALARSTTSLPQHLIEPLIQYLRGDNNGQAVGITSRPAS